MVAKKRYKNDLEDVYNLFIKIIRQLKKQYILS